MSVFTFSQAVCITRWPLRSSQKGSDETLPACPSRGTINRSKSDCNLSEPLKATEKTRNEPSSSNGTNRSPARCNVCSDAQNDLPPKDLKIAYLYIIHNDAKESFSREKLSVDLIPISKSGSICTFEVSNPYILLSKHR